MKQKKLFTDLLQLNSDSEIKLKIDFNFKNDTAQAIVNNESYTIHIPHTAYDNKSHKQIKH